MSIGVWRTMANVFISHTRCITANAISDSLSGDGAGLMGSDLMALRLCFTGHHGINMSFTGSYAEYFSPATNTDAIVYLMLANALVHDLLPSVRFL